MKLTAETMGPGPFGVFASGVFGLAVAATIAVPTAAAAPGECNAAGLATTVSGVTAAAGQYLDAHPDANQALTAAGSQAPGDAEASLRSYFGSHVQEFTDLQAIARPLTDLRRQCNQSISAGQVAALLQAFAG
jgi:heme-binding protein